jgi:hypothetical protein
MFSMSMESVSQFFTMKRKRQILRTVLKAITVQMKIENAGGG